MSWEDLERKWRRQHEECRAVANRVFVPKERYEIRMVMPVEDKCLVDFLDKEFEPEMPMSCEEYCEIHEEEEEYESCVEDCKENLKHASISSVKFDPKTLVVEEATIATSCVPLWMTPEEDESEFRRRRREFKKKFEKAGCLVDPESFEHIHPHEIAGAPEWEEEPAVCYIHPQHLDRKCRLDELLKVLG